MAYLSLSRSFSGMFDFSLAEGNIANAISEPNTALLTKDVASKYFGDWKTAIGKTLKIFELPVKVTAFLITLLPILIFRLA